MLTLSGCGGRGATDLLEARLREQEDSIFALQRDLKDSRQALESAQRQSETMHQQFAKISKGALLPEQTAALYKVTGVKVNSLLTGGVDLDDQKGDEFWTTLITPHDADGETVKLPADMELELVDLKQSGENRKIGVWTFNSEETREHWYSGFAGSGFRFELPWQRQPANSELMLVVRMKSQDGRVFHASAPLKITQSEKPALIQAVSRERLTPVEPARISFEERPETSSETQLDEQLRPVPKDLENPFRELAPSSSQADSEPASPFRIINER